MEKNNIKKVLYKEKPIATVLLHTMKTDSYEYVAKTSIGVVNFKVPKKEMGEVEFKTHEPSQLLIRWLV